MGDSRRLAGQRLWIGIPGPEIDGATRDLLEEIRPGGVVLFRRNITSRDQTRELIAELRELLGREAHPLYELDLRERARAARGDAFDLAAFHDEILTAGALPLTLLRGRVLLNRMMFSTSAGLAICSRSRRSRTSMERSLEIKSVTLRPSSAKRTALPTSSTVRP